MSSRISHWNARRTLGPSLQVGAPDATVNFLLGACGIRFDVRASSFEFSIVPQNPVVKPALPQHPIVWRVDTLLDATRISDRHRQLEGLDNLREARAFGTDTLVVPRNTIACI